MLVANRGNLFVRLQILYIWIIHDSSNVSELHRFMRTNTLRSFKFSGCLVDAYNVQLEI